MTCPSADTVRCGMGLARTVMSGKPPRRSPGRPPPRGGEARPFGADMNDQHRIAAAGSGVAALALASCLAVTGCAGGRSADNAASRPLASAPALPALSLPSAGPARGDRSLSGIHACSLVPTSVVAQVLGALSE